MIKKLILINVLMLILISCGILEPIRVPYSVETHVINGKHFFMMRVGDNPPTFSAMRIYSIRLYHKKTNKLMWYSGDLRNSSKEGAISKKIPYGYMDPVDCKDDRLVPEDRCLALPLKKGETYIMQAEVPGHPGFKPEELCPPLEFVH